MNIDDRIPDRKYIFDCFSADKAKEYVGENCYMTDDLPLFEDLDFVQVYKLDAIDNSQFFNETEDRNFEYCLPVRFVKPKEKKLRPYTFMEFDEKFTVGRPIKFRRKGAEGYERYLILNGYIHEQRKGQTFTYIYIGSAGYILQELFEEYEWQEHYTEDFKPFGVEE